MKIPFSVSLALGFVGVLIIVIGGVWTFTLFTGTGGSGTAGRETGVFGSLFPFGREGAQDTNTPGAGDNSSASFDGPVPRLRKISEEPVAGAGFRSGITGSPSVRYVERRTGHMYETPLDSSTVVRLTNTTIPAVRDAVWVSASTTVFRVWEDENMLRVFVASTTATSTDQELVGNFLPPFVRHSPLATSTLGVRIVDGILRLERVKNDGSDSRVLFTSSLTSLVPHAVGNRAFLASAPTGFAVGSLYEVVSGRLDRLFGGLSGLEVLPNLNASNFLVSSGSSNSLGLFVYDVGAREFRELARPTLVHKCAWVTRTRVLCAVPKFIPQALYPDDWLLGRVHTSDELWFIDTDSETASVAVDLEAEAGIPLDVHKVVVDSTGTHAAFIDRVSTTLWVATLTPQ
jgi:hypothetical protein